MNELEMALFKFVFKVQNGRAFIMIQFTNILLLVF